MKTQIAIVGLILLMMAYVANAQTPNSVHQAHVLQVTADYWAYLNRPPDKQGMIFWTHELDSSVKSESDLTGAFLLSNEYKCLAVKEASKNRDYTKATKFLTALQELHQDLITITGKFAVRDFVGSSLPEKYVFLGNVLRLYIDDHTILSLWVDYQDAFGTRDLPIAEASLLSTAKSVTVTYDPISGLVTNITLAF